MSWRGGPPPSSNLARTCAWWNIVTKKMEQADIAFSRNPNHRFYTGSTCVSGRYDLRGVEVHESGHVFGLNHAPSDSGQVMQASTGTCNTSSGRGGNRRVGPCAGGEPLWWRGATLDATTRVEGRDGRARLDRHDWNWHN